MVLDFRVERLIKKIEYSLFLFWFFFILALFFYIVFYGQLAMLVMILDSVDFYDIALSYLALTENHYGLPYVFLDEVYGSKEFFILSMILDHMKDHLLELLELCYMYNSFIVYCFVNVGNFFLSYLVIFEHMFDPVVFNHQYAFLVSDVVMFFFMISVYITQLVMPFIDVLVFWFVTMFALYEAHVALLIELKWSFLVEFKNFFITFTFYDYYMNQLFNNLWYLYDDVAFEFPVLFDPESSQVKILGKFMYFVMENYIVILLVAIFSLIILFGVFSLLSKKKKNVVL